MAVGVDVSVAVGVAAGVGVDVDIAVDVGVEDASTCTAVLPVRPHGPLNVTVAVPAVSGTKATESAPPAG